MKLAIYGGKPVRTKLFPSYKTIGKEEKAAVARVLDSGVLSQFIGAWSDHFYGGPQIRLLEKEWARYFKVKHAITVNSCTSGLYAAVGAIGVEPGDEIIVSPYTMSASAVAPLAFNAVPVFADIEEDCFCLDVKSIEKKITKRTKAIIVVDIFGLPYDATAINRLAKRHNLYVIEDTAQAPGAKHQGRFAGTLSDIGIYSLNYHKHIHCGEGGMIVTNSDPLAERVQLIRNHAESVVGAKKVKNLSNMLGFNFRMTEMEAAITRCQLKKLDGLLKSRQKNCEYLAKKLAVIKAIKIPKVRENCTHAYYVQAFRFDESLAGVSRDVFIAAVKAELAATKDRESEGVKIGCGYVKPLYWLPMFQEKICHGSKGFPFKSNFNKNIPDYRRGLCPVAERMHLKELFAHELMHSSMTKRDLDDVVDAFIKVWEQRKSL